MAEFPAAMRHHTLVAMAGGLMVGWTAWLSWAPVSVHVSTPRARLALVNPTHPAHVARPGRVRTSALQLDRRVVQGEVLVTLDTTDAELEVREVEARLTANQAVLQQLERLVQSEHALLERMDQAGQVAVDETAVRALRAEIEADVSEVAARQLATLRAQGAVAEMDAVRGEADAKRSEALARAERLASHRVAADQAASRGAQEASVEALRVEISRLRVSISTDTVLVERLRRESDRMLVRAPADGRLGWVEALATGQQVVAGQLVATVVPESDLRVVAEFDAATALGRLQAGQLGSLDLHAFPRTQYGPVPVVIQRVGSESHDGWLQVEAALANGPALDLPLGYGLEGRLTVTVEQATPLQLLLRSAGRGTP